MQKINPIEILSKYLSEKPLEILVVHSTMVSNLAVDIASKMKLNESEIEFIKNGAMLHDIGISKINAKDLGLYGKAPYIMHGVLGREILEAEGLYDYALICERHIGVGLTTSDIIKNNLPLPLRDMSPQSLPEIIITFADLFFSKNKDKLEEMKTVSEVRENLLKFGEDKVKIFDSWIKMLKFRG